MNYYDITLKNSNGITLSYDKVSNEYVLYDSINRKFQFFKNIKDAYKAME